MSSLECEKDPGWKYLRLTREQLIKEQSAPYDSKKNVWIPDSEEGYLAAEIISKKGDTVTVKVGDTEKTLKKDLLQEMNPPKYEKNEDMSNLTFLNDASVLYNLRSRYAAMLIYTYSGLFCVVINPYKRLPIYTDSCARLFMGKRRNEMPPHLFAVSDEAYRNMLQNKENQSMLITGESGAGKTENTKKVIAYFAAVGASQAEDGVKGNEKKVTLEDQIVQTNPVLEAFGNAKTVRNNNSSRFGKFIRIHFNRAGRLASCDIEHYLLEKSRVIRQAPGERCYHIFYQIFSGQIPGLREKLMLDKPLKDYWFVSQAELTIDGVNDQEEHQLTDEAFDILNFSPDEKMDCYKIMSAIMHMGNMKFKQRPREEQAEADESAHDELVAASAMYGVDPEHMSNALIKPRVRVGTEWVSKGQNVDQVSWSIGATAKALYARIFHWLVKKCNITLDQVGYSRDHFIGVLDIAGFEIFDFNSFEQLWINFVNEKLQQFFNHHMFVLEQEEYAREGIQWVFIDFGLDLQACIELIEKPLGIISMLDEECIVPKATDLTLAQKLVEQHLGKHPNFEKPKPPKGKQGEAHFAMRHYAGTVRYNVMNWLEKNKDPLNDTFVGVLKSTKGNGLLNNVWADYTTQEENAAKAKGSGGGKKKGKSGSFMTVSMLYRESLNTLMTMLHKTHPHFIRCIIPNEKKASGVIDASLVLNQLTCNGVLEGIRICRKGFPNRMMHKDFVTRYSILAAEEARRSDDPKVAADGILGKLVQEGNMQEEQFRIGHTKVFFKAGIVAHVEDLRDAKLNQLIARLQAQMRHYAAQVDRAIRFKQYNAYNIVQKNVRSWTVLRTWDWYRLYGLIKPHLKCGKMAEETARLKKEAAALEEAVNKEKAAREVAEAAHKKAAEEHEKLLEELEMSKAGSSAVENKLTALSAAKAELDRNVADVKDKLNDQQQRSEEAQRALARANKDKDNLNDQIANLDDALLKSEEERKAKEQRIRELHELMAKQDEEIAKANREKKRNEEENRKHAENLQAEEEKNTQSQRMKAKLERGIEDLEDTLDRERRHRSEVEKARKKLESELAATQEQIDEITERKADLEDRLVGVEENLRGLVDKLEEEQLLASRTNKELKAQLARIVELEEELEHERQGRAKADKTKGSVQQLLDDVNDQLDEETGKTTAQAELNKKKELELIRLRQEMEDANQGHESQLALLRKKTNDEIADLTERLEGTQKSKLKAEKDKEALRRQLDEASAAVVEETRNKGEQDRLAKLYESQVAELQAKVDEQHKLIQDLAAAKAKFHGDNADLEHQSEDFETQLTGLSKRKAQILTQLEDARRTADEEHQERQALSATVKNLQHEADSIKEAIDEEITQKEEILKQLSRARAETGQWKAKFEAEGLVNADEFEEEKRRRINRKLELQDTLNDVNNKLIAVEKANSRLLVDAEDARSDVDRSRAVINQFEKKQNSFDKIIDEWKKQCDDLSIEIDRSQQEARRNAAEVYALQQASTSMQEQADELRRENKTLTNDIKDLSEQLGTGGRTTAEVAKKVRQLELEKEELQHALDEAEQSLEVEENKVQRVSAEVSQIRSEIDRRIQEKEEDFENTIKNHARAIESVQTSLENETKGKNQLLLVKKKLEGDINELELALDMSNKTNVDAQKTLKKLVAQVQELQLQLDEEQRKREEFRENYLMAEKKLSLILAEKDELQTQREQLELQKQKLETEVADQRSQKHELTADNSSLAGTKRTLENDLQLTKNDLDKAIVDLKNAEENYKKINGDVQRLTEELTQEQAHYDHLERLRRGHEQAIREMQAKLEEVESNAHRLGQRAIDKLQETIRKRENELDSEQKRHKEVVKLLSKHDREVRERQFELEEAKKNGNKMTELIEKLQQKIKVHKKQLEEAEEVANTNIGKFRQIQIALEHAEERADEAENSLLRVKAKYRTSIDAGVVKSATRHI
uniref:Myosin head n=1 Tax=Panagrellus redivivus TaxID=6233 RepID=A0A7E4V522_PANRE